jgi:hypothetical protein
VDERIRSLESDTTSCNNFDCADLCEGAELIGAERLSAVIRRIDSMRAASSAPEVIEMQNSMLLRELKLLKAPLHKVVAHS